MQMQGLEERADDSEPHVGCGAWVKVGLHGERFWCKVKRVRAEDGALVATVENNLWRSALSCGDELVLSYRNVLEIADESDRLQFECMCEVLGDRREAALKWHEVRTASGLSPAVREGAVLVVGGEAEKRT